jgi:hypothetical protein
MTAPSIQIDLFRQQALALECPATEILYGGAAGGGKSHLLRACLITWALEVPGLQLYLFRRLFPDLVRNHLMGPSSFHVMLSPLVMAGVCKIVKGEIRFANGSMIHLRHLQHTKDIYSYQGTEMHVAAFDEATHFSDAEYRYLRGRCRMVGIKVPEGCRWTFPRILLCTNPGGQGHHWCKQGWIDHGPYVIHRAARSEGGMLRCFIPARMEDNPALLEADPEYIERLEGLGDPMLVRAMKEGDWNVVAGAMFAQTWRRERHVCQPFNIPVDWPIWIGADDGFAAPAAVVWLTENPNTKRKYVIRELYRSGMLPQAFADRIKTLNGSILRQYPRRTDLRPNEDPPTGLLDAAAFADTGQNEIPRGLQLRKLGIKVRAVDKWPGSRVAGCQNLHKELSPMPGDRSGLPGLQIFDTCPHLIRTLPALMRDPNNPEDVDTTGEDHLYDALRYGLQWKSHKIKRTRTKGT